MIAIVKADGFHAEKDITALVDDLYLTANDL